MVAVMTEKSMKRALLRYFSCSETTLTLLDQMAGIPWKEVEEAADPLCGGILFEMDGACGALWGAALAAGVRAQKRGTGGEAPGARAEAALTAATAAVDAYQSEESRLQCGELTGMQRWSFPAYMLKGNTARCQQQIAHWAPRFHEVIDSALAARTSARASSAGQNCACAAMRSVGRVIGFDVEPYAAVPAGLAGGLGLSGNACGALAAAIFTICLEYFVTRDKPRHSMVRSLLEGMGWGTSWMDSSRQASQGFRKRFGTKSCAAISGRRFASPSELSEYLEQGGCREVIAAVAELAAAGSASS